MILTAKQAIRDHWRDWDESFVPAPVFDVAAYQERLTAIGGQVKGQPILKLEWGGDAFITKYSDWDMAGNPINEVKIPRFAIPRRHKIMDYEMYIPVRRWIISEYKPPEQGRPDDNSDNTFTDTRGVTCIVANKPVHQYIPYIYVGDHSKCPDDCCATKLCLGDYKAPDAAELNYLLEVTYKLQSEFYCDPFSPISMEQMAQIRKEYNDEEEKRREYDLNEFDAESMEIFKTHKHRLEDYNFKKPMYITHKGENI